ncbi:hypothetical protein [Erwinia amylovora]|uniref:hypothetical protein n=1 Tax=Erwinia amylovora TaxID=552 RepID=UPI0002CC4331|nr:hypothetical protein BN432_3311 [Erwinia amylovora Ea356]
MYQQKYQMYVRVTPDRESDPEWPGKKKWFDSSRWLKDPRYIKISDSYVLNAEYKPIDNLNDFRITLTLQEAIKKSIDLELGLLNLDGMDNQSFFRHMKDNLSCEYLRTQFNSQTLTPVNDYFLFSLLMMGGFMKLKC